MTRDEEKRALVALSLAAFVGALAEAASIQWGWLRLPIMVATGFVVGAIWWWLAR